MGSHVLVHLPMRTERSQHLSLSSWKTRNNSKVHQQEKGQIDPLAACSHKGTFHGNEKEQSHSTCTSMGESHRLMFSGRRQVQGRHRFRSHEVQEQSKPLVADAHQGNNCFWRLVANWEGMPRSLPGGRACCVSWSGGR